MFRPNKVILTSLTVFMIATLTACNLGQAAEQPTATAFDIDSVKTNVASTVQAQLTSSAPTLAPTSTATLTLQASETLAETATSTQGTVPIEETSTLASNETPLSDITATPSPTLSAGDTAVTTPTFTPIGGATAIATPSFTPVKAAGGGTGGSTGPVCKDSSFQGDVTIPDHTQMKPWEQFQKVWSVKNTGTCTWDEGFYFAATDGPPSMGKNQGPFKIKSADRFVAAGQTVSIYVDMYAPGDPGEYVAHWHMFDDTGKAFGSDFTVVINVVK